MEPSGRSLTQDEHDSVEPSSSSFSFPLPSVEVNIFGYVLPVIGVLFPWAPDNRMIDDGVRPPNPPKPTKQNNKKECNSGAAKGKRYRQWALRLNWTSVCPALMPSVGSQSSNSNVVREVSEAYCLGSKWKFHYIGMIDAKQWPSVINLESLCTPQG